LLDLTSKRLLIVKPSSLGDVVHAVATAWALKERWPGLHLTWLVNSNLESLIKPIGCIDATIPFERNRFKGLIAPLTRHGELRSFSGTLRAGRFDVVLDLQGLFRSGLFSWLTHAPLRVGERSAREGAWLFYTDRVDTPEQPVHARERYAALGSFIGAGSPMRQDLDVTEGERDAARTLLREAGWEDGPLVTVCPGARWESKVYPHFARVLDELAGQGITQPVLVGGPDLADICAKITADCTAAKPVNLAGKTPLRALAALLDLSELLLTCDSGPMHMAAAQGTPTVAVFGSTDPVRTGPFGQLEGVVRGECELMPCLKRHCPGLGMKCMRDLPAARIAEKALALLRQTADNM
jgi:lipopolysaccharide heptosyltransferase II